MQMRLSSSSARGFTIIEVLIVLVLVAIILLAVFLAVPALQRSERNHERKQFVNLTAGAMEEFYQHEGSFAYPDTPAQMCEFINKYIKDSMGADGTCNAVIISGQECVLEEGSRFTLCYHDRNTSSHAYIGPLDEISIQLGHWCTPNPNPWPVDDGNPITSGDNPTHNLTKRFAIWTRLENAPLFCKDNYEKS